jgi:hypothetical protein
MSNIPKLMSGVYLTGHGGLDKLVYREDIPVPIPNNQCQNLESKSSYIGKNC